MFRLLFFARLAYIFISLLLYLCAFLFILVLVLLSSLLSVKQTGMCAQCVASKTKSFQNTHLPIICAMYFYPPNRTTTSNTLP